MDNHRQANNLDLIPNFTEAAEKAPSLYDFGRHLAYSPPGACGLGSSANQQCERTSTVPPDERVREAEKVSGMVVPSPELMKQLLAQEGKLPPDGRVPIPAPESSQGQPELPAPGVRSGYPHENREQTYSQNAGSLVLNSQAFDYLNRETDGARSLGSLPRQFQFDSQEIPSTSPTRPTLPFKRHITQNGPFDNGVRGQTQTHGDARYEPVLRVPMNSVPSCIRYRLFGDI